MKKLLIALLLICGTSYAKMNIETDSSGRPLLTQFSEEGFIDCVFRIENLTQTKQSYKFHLSASHNGAVVGFNVEVVKNIHGGFNSDMNLIKEHVYYQGVKFFRSGPESDRLLNELAALYGLPPRSAQCFRQSHIPPSRFNKASSTWPRRQSKLRYSAETKKQTTQTKNTTSRSSILISRMASYTGTKKTLTTENHLSMGYPSEGLA